jgi:uncharacterized membrane protein YhaH (DUF805 family)
MATANPYHAPKANVADNQAKEYGEVKVFSTSGRMGRLRYIGYSIGLGVLVQMLLVGAGAAIGGAIGMVLVVAGWVALVGLSILLSIQRAHDFNVTGWLAILSLVPLVNFIFWFIPGTDGENEYGLETPPNSTRVVILASIVPIVMIAGILAAIAIPAYHDYVKKAKTASVQPQR